MESGEMIKGKIEYRGNRENNLDVFLQQYKGYFVHEKIEKDLQLFIEGNDVPKKSLEVKNSQNDIELLKQVSDFMHTSFSKEILESLSISEIIIDPETVWVRVPGQDNEKLAHYNSFVPRDIFEKKLVSLSLQESELLRSYIRRASCHVAYNSRHPIVRKSANTFNTPIVVYNQEFDTQNHSIIKGNFEDCGLEYLLEIDPEQRQEMYFLGSVAHEIGHHIFENIILLSDDMLNNMIHLLDETESITEYARSFDMTKDSFLGYHERFAESIRLYTTAPQFLRDRDIKLYESIKALVSSTV